MFDSLLFLIIASYFVNGEEFRDTVSSGIVYLEEMKHIHLTKVSLNVSNGDKNDSKNDDISNLFVFIMSGVMGQQNCFAFFRFSFDGLRK